MPSEKEFGKLTHDQFATLVSRLPEPRGQMKAFPDHLRSKQERLHELIGREDYSWGGIYELPFLEQMSWLFVLLGLHTPLKEATLSEDPQEAFARWGDEHSRLDDYGASFRSGACIARL